MSEDLVAREAPKVVRGFRLVGWSLMILGTCFVIYAFAAALDPTASITVNHVKTYDRETKMNAALLSLMIPGVAAVFAFIPKKKVEEILRGTLEIQKRLGVSK